MWSKMPKENDQVKRLTCWGLIIADEEMREIMGRGDAEMGKQ